MNFRYPLIFLTGALVGGISTYVLTSSPEIQTTQNEIKFAPQAESKSAIETPSPVVEVFEVPKYPELENEQLTEESEPVEVMAEETVTEYPDTMRTQAEKFERSIASEEQAPVVSDEATEAPAMIEDQQRAEELEADSQSIE